MPVLRASDDGHATRRRLSWAEGADPRPHPAAGARRHAGNRQRADLLLELQQAARSAWALPRRARLLLRLYRPEQESGTGHAKSVAGVVAGVRRATEMTRAAAGIETELVDAMLDAQATLRLWLDQTRTKRDRTRRHVARALDCYPAWGSIKGAIIAQLLSEAAAQDVPMRLAA